MKTLHICKWGEGEKKIVVKIFEEVLVLLCFKDIHSQLIQTPTGCFTVRSIFSVSVS